MWSHMWRRGGARVLRGGRCRLRPPQSTQRRYVSERACSKCVRLVAGATVHGRQACRNTCERSSTIDVARSGPSLAWCACIASKPDRAGNPPRADVWCTRRRRTSPERVSGVQQRARESLTLGARDVVAVKLRLKQRGHHGHIESSTVVQTAETPVCTSTHGGAGTCCGPCKRLA